MTMMQKRKMTLLQIQNVFYYEFNIQLGKWALGIKNRTLVIVVVLLLERHFLVIHIYFCLLVCVYPYICHLRKSI